MKFWLDDLREAPIGFDFWYKTYEEMIDALSTCRDNNWIVEEVSLDNDLGENQIEGRKVVLWMAENEFWPNKVSVHSANPVAHEYMVGMIKRYKPD